MAVIEWAGWPRYEFFSLEPVEEIPIPALQIFSKTLTPSTDTKFSLIISKQLKKQKSMGCVPSSIGFLLGLDSPFGNNGIYEAVDSMLHVREYMAGQINGAQYENGSLRMGKNGAVSGEILDWLLQHCTAFRMVGVGTARKKHIRKQITKGEHICNRFMVCSYPQETAFGKQVRKKKNKRKTDNPVRQQPPPKKKMLKT